MNTKKLQLQQLDEKLKAFSISARVSKSSYWLDKSHSYNFGDITGPIREKTQHY